jgi:hypothetical protein
MNIEPKTAPVWMTPAIMFAQRLRLYFNIRERRTIRMAVSIKIEAPSKNP